jgi:predicted acylesterase/phospholipase RssA
LKYFAGEINMLISTLFLLFSSPSVSAQSCLAAAFEGGGSKGAYEAGVLFVFTNSTSGPNVKYNAITGISIGATNVGLMSRYPMGQEVAMAQNLVSFWTSLKGDSSIYKEWPGGLIDGLLFQAGLLNNAPAIELSQIWISGPPQRNVTVGSTNLDLGLFQTFNESLGMGMIDAVIASGSVPFAFPPHNFVGYSWADGGCICNLDVFSAVERCLDVTNEANISVDLFLDNYSGPLANYTKFKTPDVFERAFEIRGMDTSVWYIYNAMLAYPKVHFRYIVSPSQPMGPFLNFSQEYVEFNLNLGYKDGEAILKETKDTRTTINELFEKRREIIYP